MMQVSPVTDTVVKAKAAELMALASAVAESQDALRRLSEGFAELSTIADQRRKYRVACVSKALSSIFRRMPEGNPEDLPFITHVAMNFLDSLMGPALRSEEGAGR